MAQLVSKANSLIIAAFVLAFAIIALLYLRYDSDVSEAQYWVDHTYTVQINIKDLLIAMDEAETGQRGYLLTGDDKFLSPYNAARDRAGLVFAKLKTLTSDNPVEQVRLNKLSPLIQQKFDLIARSIEARRTDTAGAVTLALSDSGRAAMAQIRDLLNDMSVSESGLLQQRLVTAGRVRQRTAMLVLGGGIAAVLLLVLGGFMLRGVARDPAQHEPAQHQQQHGGDPTAQDQHRGPLANASRGYKPLLQQAAFAHRHVVQKVANLRHRGAAAIR